MRPMFIFFYYYYYSRPAIEKLVSISQKKKKKKVVVMGEIQVKSMLVTTTNRLTLILAPPRFQKLV